MSCEAFPMLLVGKIWMDSRRPKHVVPASVSCVCAVEKHWKLFMPTEDELSLVFPHVTV